MVVFAYVFMVLGVLCLIVGIGIALMVTLDQLVTRKQKTLAQAVDEKLLSVVEIALQLFREILKQPGGVFLVIGLILLVVGFLLLTR